MYDIVGDIHGCYEEFVELTKALGYHWSSGLPQHPDDRKLVFVGDLTDRGPQSLPVIEVVSQLVAKESAHFTPGNHDDKLCRYFRGNNVQIKNGLETTVAEYEQLDKEAKATVRKHFMRLVDGAPLYLTLDDGKLIVAHAGIRSDYIGRTDKKVKTFVLYGDITGEKHPDGRPVRRDWAKDYDGESWIIYGHTPVEQPRKVNNTINIDTGCVFGGSLTALKYPEIETVSVPSSMPQVEEKIHPIASNERV